MSTFAIRVRRYLVSTHCTCAALLMVPAVVLGGMMPTNALLKSPRSKFTAPRPELGGASSCQHSRRLALLAAEIAVRLKAVAWLATTFMEASTVASNNNSITRLVRWCNQESRLCVKSQEDCCFGSNKGQYKCESGAGRTLTSSTTTKQRVLIEDGFTMPRPRRKHTRDQQFC
jgi:uncharacterized membrane protein